MFDPNRTTAPTKVTFLARASAHSPLSRFIFAVIRLHLRVRMNDSRNQHLHDRRQRQQPQQHRQQRQVPRNIIAISNSLCFSKTLRHLLNVSGAMDGDTLVSASTTACCSSAFMPWKICTRIVFDAWIWWVVAGRRCTHTLLTAWCYYSLALPTKLPFKLTCRQSIAIFIVHPALCSMLHCCRHRRRCGRSLLFLQFLFRFSNVKYRN